VSVRTRTYALLTRSADSFACSYAQICVYMARQLPSHYFADTFLKSLLLLKTDRIANVRLACARALSQAATIGVLFV
jgi:hypothetical protein